MSLPRSAALAAWTAAVLAGRAGVGDAVTAVVGDEEHDVEWATAGSAGLAAEDAVGHPVPDPAYVSDLLVLLSAASEGTSARVRVALPVPGDTTGLPPAPGLVGHACDAGECLVVENLRGGPDGVFHLAAVPEVSGYGTAVEPGHHVTWTVFVTGLPAIMGAAGAPTSVAEADLELRIALRDVTKELERLEIAAWSGRGRGPSDPAVLPPLPDTFGTRARHVLSSASHVLDIVDAARDDPGGSVSGHEMALRASALGHAHRAARRAVEAAINLPG